MKRIHLLLILLALLGAALFYAWQWSPRQERVSRALTDLSDAALDPSGKADLEGYQGLDFSGGESLAFNEPKRDLFRPIYRKPQFVPPPPIVRPPTVFIPPPAPEPPPMISRPIPRALGEQPIPPLRVVGFLEKGPQRTVFLSAPQGEIYLVKKGDRFADGLLVRDLSPRQIVISRNMNDRGISLPLDAPQSQRMPDVPSLPGRPSPPPFSEIMPEEAETEAPVPENPDMPGIPQLKVDP